MPWTVPVAITAVVALWLLERASPRSMWRFFLEDSPAETFRWFWGFSSARGVATVVETILEWIDVLVVTAFWVPLPVVSMVLGTVVFVWAP